MEGHTCIERDNGEIIKYLSGAIRNSSFFKLAEDSIIPDIIAQHIARHCDGSEYTARLRLCMLEHSNVVYEESQIDHNWLNLHCGPKSDDTFYKLAFDTINRNPIRAKIAMTAIFWTYFKLGNNLGTFLRSPELSFLAFYFGNRTDEQRAQLIRDACGGLVIICTEKPCNRICMKHEVRDWIQENRNEKTSFTSAPTHVALALETMRYILSAYEQHDNAPCPDDTSMENLIRNWPELELAANGFPTHVRGARELLLHDESWVEVFLILRTTKFLQCLKQLQRITLDKNRLHCWSQRYPENVSPLVWAASENLLNLFPHLLSSDSNLEEKGSDGLSALAAAAQNGHIEIVAYLLQKRANLEARDLAGDTPLALASSYGHDEIIKLLISKGANIESEAYDFARPIIIAASNDQRMAKAILSKRGANIDACDEHGETYVTHTIRHSPLDLSRKYPKDGEWKTDLRTTGYRYKAMCRAMYYSKSKNRKDFEGLLDMDSKRSPPFGYIPGKLRQQYILQDRLGKGAFSICYSAIDRLTGRVCAIKGSQLYQSTKVRFIKQRYSLEHDELNLLKTIKHEHVMSLQNYFDEHSYIFMVFEVAQRNLREYFRHNRMSEDQIGQMMIQMLAASAYLHENDIIHCDLKPDNVLVLNSGKTFKLTDLGNSQTVVETNCNKLCCENCNKHIENCIGTPGYASPESRLQYTRSNRGNAYKSIRGPPCDVYALGTIFFEAYAYKYEWDRIEERYTFSTVTHTGNAASPLKVTMHMWVNHLAMQRAFWTAMPKPYRDLAERMRSYKVKKRAKVDECIKQLKVIPARMRRQEELQRKLRQKSEQQKLEQKKWEEEVENLMAAEAAKGSNDGRKKDGTLSKRARKEARCKMMKGKKRRHGLRKGRVDLVPIQSRAIHVKQKTGKAWAMMRM